MVNEYGWCGDTCRAQDVLPHECLAMFLAYRGPGLHVLVSELPYLLGGCCVCSIVLFLMNTSHASRRRFLPFHPVFSDSKSHLKKKTTKRRA